MQSPRNVVPERAAPTMKTGRSSRGRIELARRFARHGPVPLELEVVATLGAVGLLGQAPHVAEADGQRLGVGIGRQARVRAPRWRRRSPCRRLAGRMRLPADATDAAAACSIASVTRHARAHLPPVRWGRADDTVRGYDRRHVRGHPGRGRRDAPLAAEPRPDPQAVPAAPRRRPLPARGDGGPPRPAHRPRGHLRRHRRALRPARPRGRASHPRSATSSPSPWAATPPPPWPWPAISSTVRATRSWSACHADQAVARRGRLPRGALAAAARAAGGDIVTLGIEPTGPATGYGYVVADGRPGRPCRPAHLPGRTLRGEAHAGEGAGAHRRRPRLLERRLLRVAPRHPARRPGAARPRHRAPIAGWATAPRRGAAGLGAAWPADAITETYAELPARAIDYALLEPASLEGRRRRRAGGHRLERPRVVVGPARASRRPRQHGRHGRAAGHRASTSTATTSSSTPRAGGSWRSWASTTSSSWIRRTPCSSARPRSAQDVKRVVDRLRARRSRGPPLGRQPRRR